MTTQTAMDDDIFARPPRTLARQQAQAKPALNACVVCGLRADVLLCRECLNDIPAARSRVRSWLNANLDAGRRIIATFDALRETNHAAWDRIQDSQSLDDYAARCTKHRATGNIYGQLLDAHAAMLAQLAPLSIERARLEKALEVLEAM